MIDFFNFSGSRAERAETMLTPDYVQHNPRFLAWETRLGVHARDAWVRVLPDATAQGVRLVDLGGIPLRRPVIVMVDGDLVHAVYRGRAPDPARPGETVEAFAFEAFRLRDGRFSEHWDQVRLSPGWSTTSATPLAPAQPDVGPAPVPQPPADCRASQPELARDKRLMMEAYGGGAARPVAIRTRRTAGFIEHDPPGRAGAGRAASPAAKTAALVLADCDYAAVVWRQAAPGPDRPGQAYEAFTFDTVRFENGLVAEHWSSAVP